MEESRLNLYALLRIFLQFNSTYPRHPTSSITTFSIRFDSSNKSIKRRQTHTLNSQRRHIATTAVWPGPKLNKTNSILPESHTLDLMRLFYFISIFCVARHLCVFVCSEYDLMGTFFELQASSPNLFYFTKRTTVYVQ